MRSMKFQFFISFLLFASNSREKKSAHYEEYSDVLLPQVLFETANNTKTERQCGFSKRTHRYCPRAFFAVASMCVCVVCLRFLFGGGVVFVRVFYLSRIGSDGVSTPHKRRERGLSLCANTTTVFFDGTYDTMYLFP